MKIRREPSEIPMDGIEVFEPPALEDGVYRNLKYFLGEVLKGIGEKRAGFTHNTTFWKPLGTPVTNPIEAVIEPLYELARPGQEVIGVEWWINFFAKKTTLNPHFDHDDVEYKKNKTYYHPARGSVLYLCNVGAPTTFFNVRPPDVAKDPECWLKAERASVGPAENQYVTFAGDLYHGVFVPKDIEDFAGRDRITLLVNFWTRKPSPPTCQELQRSVVEDINNRLKI